MKKYVILAAMLAAALTMSACGNKTNGTSDATDATGATGATGTPGVVEDVNRVFDDADDAIDMDKVKGIDAKAAEDDNDSGKLDDVEVEIEDAKVIEYEGDNVIVVSFDFENKTGRDAAFDGQVKAVAEQDGGELAPAVVMGVEGISCETLAQVIGNGKEITVQKAFRLNDTENQVKISLTDAENPSPNATIWKTFNIK